MMLIKMFRLGMLHVAVAMTFVAINGVLNRIMIHELGILSTLVAILVILPYFLSPAQVWIGQYSDKHPILGYRRSPYILAGLLMCVSGLVLTPYAALLLTQELGLGIALGVVAFGLWGVGYNLAVVAYLSLASDLSPENKRSRTISVMWFMMIAGLIVTAVMLGNALEPYSAGQLIHVFNTLGGLILLIGFVALAGLEPRIKAKNKLMNDEERHSQADAIQAVLANPQARLFFVYLILMLAAILGQDILLEPFGAFAFRMSVKETTQLTALWGGMTLLSLLMYGFVLHHWMSKRQGAFFGGILATIGLLTIASSGILNAELLFRPGVAILGFGTGICTATNLSLMLDMTTSEQVGLFIGAWGVADAFSRGLGILLGGTVRDIVTMISGDMGMGYTVVFIIEAGLMLFALVLLREIDVARFRGYEPSFTELTALASDA